MIINMASIKLGNSTPTKMYVGNSEVKSIYLGSIRVWGSSTPVEPVGPAEISVSPSTINLTSASSYTTQFNIVSSNCNWVISTSHNWITVSGSLSGTGNRSNIQVSIAANTETTSRSGYIWVEDDEGEVHAEVSITQPGAVVNPQVELVAINWDNDDDDSNNNWANKQSWQIKLIGGSTSRTLNSVEAKIVDDSGNNIFVLDVPSTITLNANQTIYLGANGSDVYDPNEAQLSFNGWNAFYDEYELVFYSDSLSDQTPFIHQEI